MQLLLFLSELHLGFSVKFDNAFHDFTIKWDVLRDLVPFVQFQKNVEWVFLLYWFTQMVPNQAEHHKYKEHALIHFSAIFPFKKLLVTHD